MSGHGLVAIVPLTPSAYPLGAEPGGNASPGRLSRHRTRAKPRADGKTQGMCWAWVLRSLERCRIARIVRDLTAVRDRTDRADLRAKGRSCSRLCCWLGSWRHLWARLGFSCGRTSGPALRVAGRA